MTGAVLQVRGLRFAHPGQPPLFDALSFDLPAGLTRLDAEVGKTTLLKLLAGELRAQGHPHLVLHGQPWDPAAQPPAACLVDPRNPAWDALTPDQLQQQVRARHPALDVGAWERLLTDFDLQQHRGKTMHMLSTGSRRKVALAASLAAAARLTLLDEPTAGLDRPAIDVLAAELAAQALQPAQPARAWLLAAAWGLEDRLPWQQVLQP